MATYSKLKDGTWGVRGFAPIPNAGDQVQVTRKDGSVKIETVKRVIWTGADYQTTQLAWLAAVEATPGGNGAPRKQCACSTWDGCCRPCRCEPHCNCKGGNIYDC